MKKFNSEGFGAIGVLLLIVIVSLIGGTGYKVYNSQKATNKSLTAANNNLNSLTETKIKDMPAAATPKETVTKAEDYHDTLIAGNVRNACESGGGLKVCGEIKYRFDLDLSEVWVQYGTSSSSLDKSTFHNSDEIGLGQGDFGSYDFNINTSDLTPGTTYFYRVQGKKDGKTISGALNFFTTTK